MIFLFMSSGIKLKVRETMPKLFECFWGYGYRDASNRSLLELKTIDFFTEEKGYDLISFKGIDGLNIDEVCIFNENENEHWVRRIA
jgi:hypothetical protein